MAEEERLAEYKDALMAEREVAFEDQLNFLILCTTNNF